MPFTFCPSPATLYLKYLNSSAESKLTLVQVNFVILWHILAKSLNALE